MMMQRLAALAAVASLFVAPAVSAGTLYTAVAVPSPGSPTLATSINHAGTIVGNFRDAFWGVESHAFMATGTRAVSLGALGGERSLANAVNDRGQIAGSADTADRRTHAYIFDREGMSDINPDGATGSVAYAVNAKGVAAGNATWGTGTFAFVYDGGRAVNLGSFGGTWSSAYGINDLGEVVGEAATTTLVTLPAWDEYQSHAFVFRDGTMHDLGTLGGPFSVARAINASGEIVGSANLAQQEEHAFLHRDGTMHDLGALGKRFSWAHAINAAGDVVGAFQDLQDSRAFIYASGAMRDLNELVVSGLDGAVLTDAVAINDAGQIAAIACESPPGPDLRCMSFRLDPLPAAKVAAVEYRHAAFDHYFVTADAGEIAKLDAGTFAGWSRTGASFFVRAGATVGTAPVCRHFSTSFAPKSSHFYSVDAVECGLVRRNPDWSFEGNVFYAARPDDNGACPADTVPVFRLYNQGQGGAPNHRYTTSESVRTQMIAGGWIPEGRGALGVGMCGVAPSAQR